MNKTILDTLYNYFNSTLKSELNYFDTFLFPISPSDDLVSFRYGPLGSVNFSSILYNNPQIVTDLKSKLKSLFSETYDNLNTINLIFSKEGFKIKLNFDIILPQEIYGLIVPHLTTGQSIKSWREAGKYFETLITQENIDAHTNHLWTLITLFPKKEWNWGYISSNPNTTSELLWSS